MKRRAVTQLFGAVAAMAMAVPLAAGPAMAGMADDEAAIREIWTTYATARVEGDAEAWLALWDKGGVQMPPGIPARGFDVFEKGAQKKFAAGGVKSMTITPEEIEVAGDWAYSRGTYVSDRVVDGAEVSIDGKFPA